MKITSEQIIKINDNLTIVVDNKIEPKENDWCIDMNRKIFKHENHFPISIGQRKIIFTIGTIGTERLEGIPCIEFSDWIRIRFQNTPLEFDNYWEDFDEFPNNSGKTYTSKELYELFNQLKEK